MKKIGAVFLVAAVLFMLCSVTAFAAKPAETGAVSCYDEDGNLITVDGVYYNAGGFPCFNAECFYLDDGGEPVYVGGCRAYYEDKDGGLVPGRYCYDEDGEAIDPPAFYRGGCGFGIWCYGDDGTVESGSFYYDDFGNPVDPPRQPAPRAGRGGGCCGGRWR